jgi:hypothetical protein
MKPRHLLKELEKVAHAVELSVRTQPFRNSALSAGGLCKLRGERVVLLNSRSPEDERALVLGEVLSRMDTTHVPMSDFLREFLQERQPKRSPAVKQDRTGLVGPGLRRALPKRGPEGDG